MSIIICTKSEYGQKLSNDVSVDIPSTTDNYKPSDIHLSADVPAEGYTTNYPADVHPITDKPVEVTEPITDEPVEVKEPTTDEPADVHPTTNIHPTTDVPVDTNCSEDMSMDALKVHNLHSRSLI